MTKRVLALLVTLVFVIAMVPAVSLAAITDTATSTVVVGDNGAGMWADAVEDSNGIVKVTIKLKGVVNSTTVVSQMSFNSAKVLPYNRTTQTTLAAKVNTSATVAPYIELLPNNTPVSGDPLYGWKNGNYIIDPAGTTKYFSIGFAKETGSDITVADGSVLPVYAIYFKKVAGQTIDSSTFAYYKTTVPALSSKIVYGATNVVQNGTTSGSTYNLPAAFTSTVTPYNAEPTDVELPAKPTPTDDKINLPGNDNNGKPITWNSDKPWISADGDVIRPPFASGDQVVTLTATSGSLNSAQYQYTIPAMPAAPALHFAYVPRAINMNGVNDVALDSAGDVYAVDFYNSRVVKFNAATGATIFTYTGLVGAGSFNKPAGIYVDASDNVYVADTYNNRVVMFKDNGDGVLDAAEYKVVGSTGDGAYQFNRPMGIWGKDSKVYVADAVNNKIAIFNMNGTGWTEFGSTGSANGMFKAPNDVAVDAKGNIYVSDTANKRVQMFKSTGDFRISYPADSYVYGIDVDAASGNVFVSERFLSKVMVINNTKVDGSKDNAGYSVISGGFMTPIGIYVRGDYIYVADPTRSQISVSPISR